MYPLLPLEWVHFCRTILSIAMHWCALVCVWAKSSVGLFDNIFYTPSHVANKMRIDVSVDGAHTAFIYFASSIGFVHLLFACVAHSLHLYATSLWRGNNWISFRAANKGTKCTRQYPVHFELRTSAAEQSHTTHKHTVTSNIGTIIFGFLYADGGSEMSCMNSMLRKSMVWASEQCAMVQTNHHTTVRKRGIFTSPGWWRAYFAGIHAFDSSLLAFGIEVINGDVVLQKCCDRNRAKCAAHTMRTRYVSEKYISICICFRLNACLTRNSLRNISPDMNYNNLFAFGYWVTCANGLELFKFRNETKSTCACDFWQKTMATFTINSNF